MKYSLGIEKNGKFVEILTGSLKEIDELTRNYPNKECLAVGLYLLGHDVDKNDNIVIKSSNGNPATIMYSEYPLNNQIGNIKLFNEISKMVELLGSIYENLRLYDSDTGNSLEIPVKISKETLSRVVGEKNIKFFENIELVELFRNLFYKTNVFDKDGKYLTAINYYYYKLKGTLNSTVDISDLEDRYYQAICIGLFRFFYRNPNNSISYRRARNSAPKAQLSYRRVHDFYTKIYNELVVKRIPKEQIDEYNDRCLKTLISQLESQCSIEERYRDEIDMLDDPDSPDYDSYKIIEEREDSPKGL